MGRRSAARHPDPGLAATQRLRLHAALDGAGEQAIIRVGDDALALTHLDRVYWPAHGSRTNVRGKSMTVAYSPRGLAGAPVSMPLAWRALPQAQPGDFRIANVPPLLRSRGDAWTGWLEHPQSVEAALTRDIDASGQTSARRRQSSCGRAPAQRHR